MGSEALRRAVERLGAGPAVLPLLARHGAAQAMALRGLAPDQTRVVERELRRLGGEVVATRDADRVVLFGSLAAFGELSTRLVAWGRRTEALGLAIGQALAGAGAPPPPLEVGGRRFGFGSRTYVVGVVNCTPDSFSGDGVGDDLDAAVERALALVAAGADLLDVGGESTRPHSVPVPAEVERARVVPVIAALAPRLSVPISIDTRKAEVAAAAIAAGATMVNDIWGLRGDPRMAAVCAEAQVAVVAMHNAAEARYDDVVEDVAAGLRQSLAVAEKAGIDLGRVVVDPGIGFAKSPVHNLELLRRLGELRGMARPLLVGASRKSTIGYLLGGAPPHERLEGSLALAVLAAARGADFVRVHDVAETVRALRVADAVLRGTPPEVADLPPPGPTG